MKNDGSAAQLAFVDRIMETPNSWVERFRDAKDLRGINGGRAVGDFAKPADFLVTQHGETFYSEVKSTSNARRFSFGQIESYQHATALKMAAVGGHYFFFIFSFGTSKWYILDCQTYAKAVSTGSASILLTDLIEWESQEVPAHLLT